MSTIIVNHAMYVDGALWVTPILNIARMCHMYECTVIMKRRNSTDLCVTFPTPKLNPGFSL